MRDLAARAHRQATAFRRSEHSEQLVLATALIMIFAQLGYRSWALYPSWFFADDYSLLLDARARSLPTFGYLVDPFNIHFMPIGRLLAWVVAHSGTTAWVTSASLTLLLQLMASLACFWMLVTLFGMRWANVALLALYLTSAMAMPSFMWWAAALNQLPVQLAFFIAVGWWVRYLRWPRVLHLALAVSALVVGLMGDLRAMLIPPLLLYLTIAYFCRGSVRERLTLARRQYSKAIILISVIGLGYATFYLLTVPSPFEDSQDGPFSKVREIADSMLGTAMPTGLWGGPWQWLETTPPIVLAGPPQWLVHLSWVLTSFVVAYALLRRERAGRAWVLLAGYSLALYVLLAASRGQIYGAFAGLEYRYLTDMVCVLPLCLGLAFMELAGAPDSSVSRADPLLRVRIGSGWMAALVALVSFSSLVSSVRYVQFWHHGNPSRDYVKNAQAELDAARGPVDLPRQVVPEAVMPSYTVPDNTTDNFLPLLAANVRFPEVTDRLHMLDANGHLLRARVEPSYRSTAGRVPDCGRRLTTRPTVVPLNAETSERAWWVRLGYLSTNSTPVTVAAGDIVVRSRLREGVHSLFLQSEGGYDSIRISGISPGTIVCLDTIEVGDVVPQEDE